MAATDSLERTPMIVSYYRSFQRFRKELGDGVTDWPELGDFERYAWIASWDALAPAVEATADSPKTFHDLSRVAYEAWRGGRAYGEDEQKPPAFDALDEMARLVWRCLVRHAANLLVFDTAEDGGVERHEEQMAGFFAVKARELKESLSNP